MNTLKLSLAIVVLLTISSSCNDQVFQPGEPAPSKAATPIIGENGTYLLEPQKFSRRPGPPTTFEVPLAVENFQCITHPYFLNVENGNGINAVTSAIISIDGSVIFNQSDFKKNVRNLISEISIQDNSLLKVELRGKPGSYITVSIEGTHSTCRWEYTYGEAESVGDFIRTTDGGFVFIGNYYIFPKLVKLTRHGLVEWEKIYESLENISGSAISQTKDGGYIFTGNSIIPNSYGGTCKINKAGDIEWVNAMAGGVDIIQDRDLEYIIVTNKGVAKLGHEGDLLWSTEIDNDFRGGCAIEDVSDEGGFVIGGMIENGTDTFAGAKINDSGELLWLNSYGEGDYFRLFTSVAHDGHKGFFFAGNSGFICNINGDGSLIFIDQLVLDQDASNYVFPSSIIPSSNGFIVGTTLFPDIEAAMNWEPNCWIIEINHQGMQLRNKLIERQGAFELVSIVLCDDGDFVIGGSKNLLPDLEFWALKDGFDH